MNNTLLKKVTASAAALSIVLSVVAPVVGVKAADASVDAANRLAALNVIEDHSNNPSAYNLGSSITRREMLKVMMNLSSVEVTETCTGKFSDLNASDWGCKYAEAALEAGFIAANARFRPNDMVTEAEALKMVMQARGVEAAAGVEPWGEAYRVAAVEAGILSADSKISATSAAKRSFVFIAADDAVNVTTGKNAEDDEDDFDFGGIFDDLFGDDKDEDKEEGVDKEEGNENNNSSDVKAGDLEVSLNPASPVNGSSIPYQGIVNVAKVDFSAGDKDISLNSVEVKKAGLFMVSTKTKVWFEVEGRRISSRASFTSEGNVVVSFAPALVVKAGSTESLDLVVELEDQNPGSDYAFTSGEINASAQNVKGSFTTNTLRTSNYKVIEYTLAPNGSDATYNVNGNESYELASFKVTSEKGDVNETRDLSFKTITLYQNGAADLANLNDIELVRNGEVVSSKVTVDGKALTIQLKDTIKDGATAIYYLRAKVAYVDRNDEVYEFYTKNTSDVVIDEVSSGIRSKSSTNNTLKTKKYTVKGSDIVFTRDTSVALSNTVALGSSEVVLLQGFIEAKNAVNLENVNLEYTYVNVDGAAVALSDYFSTVYLRVGNSTLTSSVSGTGTTNSTGALSFDGTVTVSGKVPVKMYTNLKSGSGLREITLKVNELTLASFGKGGRNEYVSNQEVAESAVGSIPAVSLTVGKTTFNVTRNDGRGNTNMTTGQSDVVLLGNKLTTTQGNAVRVTSVDYTFTGTTNYHNNGTVTLYVNGDAVKSKTIDNTDKVRFDGFNFDVTKEKSVDIVLKANFNDGFSTGSIMATIAQIEATDTVSSTDLTKKSIAISGPKYTIADATVNTASSTSNPKSQLITAGKTDNKLFVFRLTAKNDSVSLKDVALTGTGLNAFNNYRLGNDIYASSVDINTTTNTGTITFKNISADAIKINQDQSVDITVYADAVSNFDSVVATELTLDTVVVRGSNGSERSVTLTSTPKSNVAKVHERTLQIFSAAMGDNKHITSNALRFSLRADGIESLTLSGLTLKTSFAGYTGSNVNLEVRKVNGDDLVFKKENFDLTSTGLTLTGTTTIDANGQTETYYIKFVGAMLDDTNQSDWSVSIEDIEAAYETVTINLKDYADNLTTLPITSSK